MKAVHQLPTFKLCNYQLAGAEVIDGNNIKLRLVTVGSTSRARADQRHSPDAMLLPHSS